MKKLILLMSIVLMLSSAVSAFDGMRKGFVLGGGLGLSADSKASITVLGQKIESSASGAAGNFFLGYGWDEANMLVFESNISIYKPTTEINDITQGVSAVTWYHYFGEKGKTFFSTLGIGQYSFEIENEFSNEAGTGILIGGGYEFSPHYNVGIYLNSGKTKFLGVVEFEHSSINIIASAVAF